MRHFYKALIKIGCLIFLSFQIKQTSLAQATVSSAGNETICIGGNAITLDDILIAESNNADFQNTTGIESYEISVPSANFEFNTGASVLFNHTGAGTVTNTSVNITPTTITLNYSLANTANGLDNFTISGIEVLALNTLDVGNIVRTGGTATQTGNEIADNQIHASLTSSNGPTADAGAYAAICAGETINLNGVAGGMDGTITWSALSGNFSNVNDLNATYTPTITSGNVTLTLSIDPDGTGGCTPARNDAIVTVLAKPDAPVVSFESVYQVGEVINTAPIVTSDDSNLEWHSDLSLSSDISITSGNAASPNLIDLGFSTASPNNTIVYVTNTIAGCRSEPTAIVLLVSDGVNVTEAPNAEKLCVGGNAINIGDIVITESDSYGFSNTQSQVSIELSSPSPKFEFFTGGGISVSQTQNGGTFSNLSVVATTDRLTINYEMTDTQNGIDELTISGVRIQAIGNNGVGEILRTGGDALISGIEISDVVSFATVKSFNTITVNAGSDVNVCAGETVLLQGSFDGAASSAVWSGPGTFADNTSLNTIYTPASTTGATVETLTLTSNDPDGPNGCDPVSATVNINIRGIPTAPSVNFTQNACVGDVLTRPVVTSGNNNLKWHSSLALENDIVVTSGDPTSPNLTDLGFSSVASGSSQVYVTQTSPFGCESAPTVVRLTVNEVPTAPIITQPTINICQNDNSPISISAIGDNLRWYRNDDSFIIQSNTFDPVTMGEINTASSGSTTFKVSQVKNNCESNFSTITVEVQALPNTSAINGLNTICAGTQGVIYSVTEVAGHTYTWNLSGGGTISSGQGTSSIAINWNSNTSGIANYTLSVLEEDETGCVDTQVDLIITVNPVPNVSFTGIVASYSSSDINSYELTGTPTGGTFYGRGVSFNTTTSKYEFAPSEAGTGAIPIGYRFETAEGCIVDATPFVTNVGVPSASNINGLNAARTYCVNDENVLLLGNSLNTGSRFFFSTFPIYGELENDPAFPANNDRAIFSPSKVGAGTYFLFYFNGISFGSAEEVTVFDIPNSPTTENNLVYCQGDNLQPLNATGIGTIKWYTSVPSPGNEVITATNGVATAAELGLTNATNTATVTPINIWVTQTDGNGCESDPEVISISVIEKPSLPVVSSSIPNYCNGDILQDIIVSGESGAIWEWSETIDFSTSVGTNVTNGVTSTFSNPIVLTSNVASSNTITYYVRQQVNGCYSDPQQIDIIVFPIPNAPILSGIIPTYCPGDILQDIIVNGTLGGVYEWSDTPDFSNLIGGITNVGNSSTFNYPIVLDAPGDVVNTYKFYVRQRINGCYSPSTELEVTVNPTPDTPIVASARLNYCHGEILEDIVVAGENGANWQWSNTADFSTTVGTNSTSGNNSIFKNPIVLTAFGPGASTVNFWVRQQINGCYSEAEQISITVYPIPNTPTLNNTSFEYCAGSTIEPITVSGITGASFKWYSDVNLTNQVGAGDSFTPGINNTVSSVSKFYVTQTFFSNGDFTGCTSSPVEVEVTIYDLPIVSIADLNSAYCIDNEIDNIRGIPEGGTFSGAGITDNIFDPASAGIGSHIIKYYYQNLNGCLDSASQLVTVNSLPGVTFNQLEPTYCINDASLALNGFPEGGTFLLNGSPMSDVFRPDVIGVGEHEIIYTFTDANTCVNADTQHVTIFPAPEVAFSTNDFCVGEPTTFVDESIVNKGNIVAWQWNFNDGTESTIQNPTHVFNQIGFYKVGLTVFTENNCSDYVENDIYIGAIPEVDFNWTNTCVNDILQFENNSNVEGENLIGWLWEFGDGNISNEFAPRHDYTVPGIYQVKLTVFSETNCVATINKDIAIFPSIDNYPYADNFENTTSGWVSFGINNSWEISVPSGSMIPPITPASKSWITNANGNYNNDEQSYVESPCFDLTSIERPKISFDIYYDTQEGFDGAVLQSSVNDGQTWELVGSIDDPINWFNTVSINGNPGGQSIYGWSGRNMSGWLRVSHVLDDLKNEASVRFRIAFGSDPSFNEGEGFAFDNFRIEEREKLVLLETFTNSSNNNDALINPASRDQIDTYSEDIIPINYHTNFPGTDPLNRTNAADPSARALYYGVLNTPRTVIDGITYEPTDATPFWNAENLIERALEKNTVDMVVTFGEPNTETLDISVTAEALTSIEDEVAFQVVCVERNITEVTGENGEIFFDWVVRKMLPDAAGTGFSNGFTENERISFNVSWKPENIFDPENMLVIAFAQNNITKEIYNVVAVKPDYFPDIVSSLADRVFSNNKFPVLFPNPAKEIVNIALDHNLNNDLDWELITVDGQVLKSGLITKGQNRQVIEIGLLPRGTYFIKYHLNGEFVLAQKFVKL